MQRVTISVFLGLALLAAGCGEAATTASPTPTATPVGAAILGATEASFIAKYGQPTNHPISGDPNPLLGFGSHPDNTDAPLLVYFGFGSNPVRAHDILASSAPGQSWSMAEARAMCEPFLPPDSVVKQHVIVLSSTTGAVAGEDTIYTSQFVSQWFDPNSYLDANSHQVAVGTFDLGYLYVTPNDASRSDGCGLNLGTTQTTA